MKEALVVVGVVITFIAYIPYFRDIFDGKTKPHAFTWLIWSLLTAIAFSAQVSDGGGIGSVILGITAVISFIIFLIALKVGKKNIVKVDWIFLFGSLLALVIWFLTEDPFWSVILITIIDAVAFAPTFRKAYIDPYTETLSTFLLSAIKFIFAIAALEAYTTVTVLYPLSLVFANGLFVLLLIIRRKQLPLTAINKL